MQFQFVFFFRSGRKIEWFPFGLATSWTLHFDFDSVFISRCYFIWLLLDWISFKMLLIIIGMKILLLKNVYVSIDTNEIFKLTTKFLGDHANTFQPFHVPFESLIYKCKMNVCLSIAPILYILYIGYEFHVSCSIIMIRMHYYYSSFFCTVYMLCFRHRHIRMQK